jgi:phosphate transport system substrate-binding protein
MIRSFKKLACATLLLGVLIPVSGAQASGPTITGAGSTWAAIALDQWRADGARLGLNINYQGVGSTAGRQFYIIGQVDFAATEIPFLPDEVAQLKGEHKSYQYLPDVAGGTAVMYNIKDTAGRQVKSLRLSAATITKIFTGKITSWSDPAIAKDNPGLKLPPTHLTPVIRADGAGTSAKLADYLAHEDPSEWNPFASANSLTLPVQFWPNFPGAVAVQRSDGVANYVSNPSVGVGSIGYVEAGYAYEHGFTPAYIKNHSGAYAAPSSENVAVALKHATLNHDLTQNLLGVYNAPETDAYPLASYSYLVTPTTGLDPAKGAVLGKWIIYIACAGQKEAAPLGYSPLPPNLVAAVFSAVKRIPGAPTPPPINSTSCPNPTVTGSGYGGSPQSGGGGTQSGGTQPTGGGTQSTTPTKHHTKTTKTSTPATTPVASSPGSSVGVTVTPLSAAQQAAAYKAAVTDVTAAQAASSQPLLLAAAVLAAIVLVPALILRFWRRRTKSAPETLGQVESSNA